MHILVVEDHGETRSVLARLLDHCGYQIVVTGTVQDALHLLDKVQFDSLLCDIGLPDGDGYHLVTEAKKRQPLKRAIALTAHSTDADRLRGEKAGFDHYLSKPLDFEELRRVLGDPPRVNAA